MLDDSPDGLKIQITNNEGTHRITIDGLAQSISITADTGDIEVQATDGAITVQGLDVTVKAAANLTLQAGSLLSVQAPLVKIN